MSNWISHFTLSDVDFYVVAIVLLLPITTGLLVFQTNPYQALVIRGILGAIAALVYVLFGAADVALTEALVGTMLSITLYAVAVRSSMSMRLGVLTPQPSEISSEVIPDPVQFNASPLEAIVDPPLNPQFLQTLRTCLKPYHLRLEISPYPTLEALHRSLQSKDVQTICIPTDSSTIYSNTTTVPEPDLPTYHLHTRLERLHQILRTISPTIATVTYQQPDSLDTPKLTSPIPETVET